MSRRDAGSRKGDNYRDDRHDAGRTVKYPLHPMHSERTSRRMRSVSPVRSTHARLRGDFGNGPRDPSPRRMHSRSPLRGPQHGAGAHGFRGRSPDGYRRRTLEPHSLGSSARDRRMRSPPPVPQRGPLLRVTTRMSPPQARGQSPRIPLHPLSPRYPIRSASSPRARVLLPSPRSSIRPVSPRLVLRPVSPQIPLRPRSPHVSLRPPRMPSPPLTSAFDRGHDRHTHETILASRNGPIITLPNPPLRGTGSTDILDKQEDEPLSGSGMLVSRSIFMNDGTVGTFYALPPDPVLNPLQSNVDNPLGGQVLPSFSDDFSQYTSEPASLRYSGLDKFVPIERDFLASQDQRLSDRTLLGQSQYVASDRNLPDYPRYTRNKPLSPRQNTFEHPLQKRGSRSPLRSGDGAMSFSKRAGYESELDRASRRINYDKRDSVYPTEVPFRDGFGSPHRRRIDQDYMKLTKKDGIGYGGGERNGQVWRMSDDNRVSPPRYSAPMYDLRRQKSLGRSPEPRGSSRFELRSSGFPRQMRTPPRESSRHDTGLQRHMDQRTAFRRYPSPERFNRSSPRRMRSLTPPIMRKHSSFEEERRAWKRKYIEMGGEPFVNHRSSHNFEPGLKRRERDMGNDLPHRNDLPRERKQTGWDQKDGWLDRRDDFNGRSGYRPITERIRSPAGLSRWQVDNDRRHLEREIMEKKSSDQQDLPPDLPEDSAEFKQQVQRCLLKYAKIINEDPEERKKYEEQGKAGTLLCVACGRLSKTFVDTHSLVMHTLQTQKKGLRAEHLGLCKAICTTLGWSHTIEPANGKDYQDCSAEESKTNREDLILWPPAVIVHCMGEKPGGPESVAEVTVKDLLKDTGLFSERLKITHGKGGTVVVKYPPLLPCLNDAVCLHNHFASKDLGRDNWSLAKLAKQESDGDGDSTLEDDECPEKSLLFGYLALAQDLDKVDTDLQRRCQVKSRKDIEAIVGDPLAAKNAED